MPAIGEILDGRYEIINEIGAGGAGIVFLGYHRTLCKYVVVKKVKEQMADFLDIRGEADILKGLHHRYLPQVYDFLVIDREIFTVMDYVNGRDLKWYIENRITFSEEELVRMLLQLCEVLEYLHTQKPPVIHGDIKPGNIMLREDGDICLIDFNISISGGDGAFTGCSYQYAAPEQIEAVRGRGRGLGPCVPDARADIYSLGATFFYLMTGIMPKDETARDRKRFAAEAAYSDVLFRIIQKAMSSDPNKRYSSAEQMKRAVRRGTGRKRTLFTAAVSAGTALLLTLGIMAAFFYVRERKEEMFAAAYAAYIEGLSSGDTQTWIRGGISLLNEHEFADLLESKPKQKAVILESIADGYYEEGNYSAAADYYKEALLIRSDSEKKAEDARDLVLSLLRSGNTAEARRELQIWQEDLSAAVLQYVEVEFLLQEGRTVEALEQMDQLLLSAQDREILLRCCLFAAECLQGTDEYERRMNYLNQAKRYVDTVLAYRRIGEGFLKIVQEEPEERVGQEALDRAEECYEKLCADGIHAGYVDRLNLAAVRQMKEKYESAMEVLKELMEEFPEDYRAYRDAAFDRYRLEMKKAVSYRSMQAVLYYGKQAFALYDEKTDDGQMVQLRELMERLSSEQGDI